MLFDLKSGLAREGWPGTSRGRSRWHSRSYCHEEITCVMRREWDSRPASGHRIIDITTKAACAVTLKIDWTMYPVVDKATSCYTCPWIYALVHHCDESKRKSQILRFSVLPGRIEPYANGNRNRGIPFALVPFKFHLAFPIVPSLCFMPPPLLLTL